MTIKERVLVACLVTWIICDVCSFFFPGNAVLRLTLVFMSWFSAYSDYARANRCVFKQLRDISLVVQWESLATSGNVIIASQAFIEGHGNVLFANDSTIEGNGNTVIGVRNRVLGHDNQQAKNEEEAVAHGLHGLLLELLRLIRIRRNGEKIGQHPSFYDDLVARRWVRAIPRMYPDEKDMTHDQESKDDEDSTKRCTVCWSNVACCVAIPCHHVAMCISCARTQWMAGQVKCPVCQVKSSSIHRLFYP